MGRDAATGEAADPAVGVAPVASGRAQRPSYRRVLLKLSGDAFAPPGRDFGISEESVELLAGQLAEVLS